MKLPYNLHRVEEGRQSDWEGLTYEEMNPFQRLAEVSKGIVTIGNVTSLASTVLTLIGIELITHEERKHKVLGAAAIILGRLGDLADGKLADITGTKSKLGANLDGSLDTVQVAFALSKLSGEGKIIPTDEALATGALTLVKTASAIETVRRGGKAQTSFIGKLQTGAFWSRVGLGSLSRLAEHFEKVELSEQLESTADNMGKVALAMNALSTSGYAATAYQAHMQPVNE